MSARTHGNVRVNGHIDVLGRQQRNGLAEVRVRRDLSRVGARLSHLHQLGGHGLESGHGIGRLGHGRGLFSDRWVADPGPPGAQPHEERAQGETDHDAQEDIRHDESAPASIRPAELAGTGPADAGNLSVGSAVYSYCQPIGASLASYGRTRGP